MNNTFYDRRGREWEYFEDKSYYDMLCVRLKSDRSFNSQTNFHFGYKRDADKFIELIKISS